MKKVIVFALLALAVPAMAADIAKSPMVYSEGVVTQYNDTINRGNVAVAALLDGTFQDLAPIYAAAISALGCSPDIYYDPAGSINYGALGYDLVVATCSDNWWYSVNYPMEISAWSTYMAGGGKIILVGQDFLYGSGDYSFPTTYCGMTTAVEDVNYNDSTTLTLTGLGPLAGFGDSMVPCFTANPWFTDNVHGSTNIGNWSTSGYPGPYGAGSASMVGIFSVVEFGCGNCNGAVSYLAAWLQVTPTEAQSLSAIKALY